jgi:hypothetical protein
MPFDVLVVGDCPTGADLYASEWHDLQCDLEEHFRYMRAHGTNGQRPPGDPNPETHPVPRIILGVADWSTGRGAGPARNTWMVMQCEEGDVCLAFYQDGEQNRGTDNCALAAELAGLEVRRYDCPEEEGPPVLRKG